MTPKSAKSDNLWQKTQLVTVSVIGGHDTNKSGERLAHKVGKIIAEVGGVLVCGGLSGVMEHAAKGAKSTGGLTIGLLPGKEKADANPYIDIALPTTFGFARNAAVACSADVVVALPGSHGTLSEICYAMVYKRPVIDLGGWKIKGMVRVKHFKDFKQVLRRCIIKARS